MEMNEWGSKIPLRWLMFRELLRRLKESNVPISSTEQLQKIAKQDNVGINNEPDFKLCLQYFHDAGIVVYFDADNLKDYVILDPNWFFDAFKCLASVDFEPDSNYSNDLQNLRKTGELKLSLISYLFGRKSNLKFSENKPHLLEVMQKFDILVKGRNPTTTLYMPCMIELSSLATVDHECKSSKKTSWLCLEFDVLPVILFHHIITWFTKQYIVKCISERDPHRQIAVFELKSKGLDKLVVCEEPNLIAVQIQYRKKNPVERNIDLHNKLVHFVTTFCKKFKLRIQFTESIKSRDAVFPLNNTKNMTTSRDNNVYTSDWGKTEKVK